MANKKIAFRDTRPAVSDLSGARDESGDAKWVIVVSPRAAPRSSRAVSDKAFSTDAILGNE